ncbi:hypothetical protein VFPPC_00701 [Pochonia chlamydosporia 170]|uniref:Uncharacterized protein n=1 Tax=Pochonia chlamydosporia 170 TaxID=1380566 RepID=A0A179G4V0_METCM|nr:hypothetical protein VFPPC_00701 [Pochonia chlamydosporia 170]OAQ72837.1 hypothetical protein VFPPC_00701 [Pochonia chlamydosporia 170]
MILVGNSHRHCLRRVWKVYRQAYETFPDRALSLVTQVSLYMILLRMTLPRFWRAGCSRIGDAVRNVTLETVGRSLGVRKVDAVRISLLAQYRVRSTCLPIRWQSNP